MVEKTGLQNDDEQENQIREIFSNSTVDKID
jgi:hypothetical protein